MSAPHKGVLWDSSNPLSSSTSRLRIGGCRHGGLSTQAQQLPPFGSKMRQLAAPLPCPPPHQIGGIGIGLRSSRAVQLERSAGGPPKIGGGLLRCKERLEAARHVERAADDSREAGRSSRREGAADHWSSEGKVAACSEPARGVAGVRPPPHMGLLHQRPLSQRSSPHRPTMHADGSLSPHASPKIPQNDRGYARFSRCGLAEVRQFTYLLTRRPVSCMALSSPSKGLAV